MRVIMFGTSAFAVPSLERLAAAHHEIIRCITQPDRPQGRGRHLQSSPLKEAALRLSIPIAQPERLSLTSEQSWQSEAEVGVVAAYGQLIPQALLDLPPHGMLGVHPSLLPKYRGAAPIPWAILNGEKLTGVTIFRLTKTLDAGPMICQESTHILPREDSATLMERLSQLGARALLQALQQLAGEHAHFQPQDETQATFAPRLTKDQGSIDWSEPAIHIERLVRAMTPWPGASTRWKTTFLKVWKTIVESASNHALPHGEPGTIVRLTPAGIEVSTGEGNIILTEIQPAGRRRMSAGQFLAGHPLQIGEQLGTGNKKHGTW